VPSRDAPDLFAAAPLPVAPLDDAQRLACLRLIRSENVGPATFRALVNHYGGAREALAALPDVARKSGRSRPIRIHPADQAEEELAAATKAGVRLLFTIEPGFPGPLAFADGAPPLLYVKGRSELLNRSIIAVVGSRQSSGYIVASGLARGIDAAAHQATLETGTVAVLAGGLDVHYPPEHRQLQAAIAERGCLISEMPLGFQPRAQDFPRRNRIISGISRGVVVIEAAKRSGTLITARLANEQGREVFAVPGHPLDPRAEGTNQLIKDGASMATAADDVLEALSRLHSAPHFRDLAAPAPGPPESAIGLMSASVVVPTHDVSRLPEAPTRVAPAASQALDLVEQALGPAPVAIDEIGRATGLATRDVQIAIMELALAGVVEFHGGQLVSLKASD
jgi:DNA processing protein